MAARILVTGATGFVGTRLCADLLARGQVFRAVSRTARDGYFTIGDVDGATGWAPALVGCEAVVHLMARVHRVGEAAPAAYRAENVDATLRLARQAAEAGVRRLVFLSSIKVHGEATATGQAFSEADVPAPRDAYGASKLEAEFGLRRIAEETGLEVTVLRPPLVYGAGAKANLRTLMRWVVRGVPLPLGAVDNRRSMLGLGNLSDAIIRCVDHPGAGNRTFVVSDGEDVSTAELLRRLARLMGRRSRLLPVPAGLLQRVLRLLGRGDLATRLLGDLRVDSGAIRRELGWVRKFGVEQGLGEMVAGFRAE